MVEPLVRIIAIICTSLTILFTHNNIAVIVDYSSYILV